MSLLTALDTALSGMRATQLAVQTASNNLANASDPNYTRKTIITEALPGGSSVGGVRVTGYGRTVNDTLNKAYLGTISDGSMASQQQSVMGSVKDLFGVSTDTTALVSTITKFGDAWQALAAAPEDTVRQSSVITTGAAVANEIKRLSAGVEAIDRGIKADTSDAVTAVNSLLTRIQQLNNQVSSATISGDPAGSFQDQRDTAVRELSQYVKINQLAGDNGTIKLLTPTGFTLFDGTAQPLKYDGTTIRDGNGTDVGTTLAGGSLQAMLDLRADSSPASPGSDPGVETIRKLRSQLDQIASSFLSTTGTPASFAAAYNNATTTSGQLASGFFTGSTRFDIQVNDDLNDGTQALKQGATVPVAAALNDGGRTINAAGVAATGVSYAGFANAIITGISQGSNVIDARATNTAATQNTFKERVTNASGVNTDQELVGLTALQNSYAASARVISIVKDMFDTLDGLIR